LKVLEVVVGGLKATSVASVVDPDPGGSASFWRIRLRFNSTKCKAQLYFSPENFNIQSKILKILKPMTLTRKIKQCELALLRLKAKKFLLFQYSLKLLSDQDRDPDPHQNDADPQYSM
jgi:hypothetical protein